MGTLTTQRYSLKRIGQGISVGLAALLLIWLHRSPRNGDAPGQAKVEQGAAHHPAHATHRFSRHDVLTRLKSHSATHYAGLYNVMKGVTLAAVGLVAVNLLTHSVPPERTLLLIIALGSILVSYNGEAIGQAIIHLHPATIDVALPMALTVAELVVVVIPGVGALHGAMPAEWFMALAAWNLLAATLVASVAWRIDTEMYEPYLWPAVEKYQARMWFDAKCAGAVGVTTLVFLYFRHPYLPEASMWEYGFLIGVGFAFAGAITHHEATRKELKEALLAIANKAPRSRTLGR